MFQSHLGSILPRATIAACQAPRAVSIPPWFDFALKTRYQKPEFLRVSIPPWFDFARGLKCELTLGSLVSIPPWFDFAQCELY